MSSRLLFIGLLILVACSHPQRVRPPAREANCVAGVISDTAVSGLPIRATVASVKEHCRVLVDTTYAGLEGLPERTLDVQIGDDTLVAQIDSDRVVAIDVDSPRLQTRDSLAVGTSLATLLRHGHAKALIGEGSYYVLLETHCGLSFGLPYFESRNTGDLNEAQLRALPDTIRIRSIRVVDCESAQGAT